MRTAISPHKAVRRRLHRSVLVAVSMVAAIVVSFSLPAQATDISIPFDDLVFGTPGSVVSIAVVEVDSDMVGQTCHLVVVAENQSSVHPGNDLIVSTSTSQAVILGVEDTANGGTSQTYEMLLGPTIAVELRIGQDGMSSLGFDLSFDCVKVAEAGGPALGEQVVTSSTTTTTTTTTTAPAAVAGAGCTTASGAAGVTVGNDCCVTTATSSAVAAAGADCCTTADGASGASTGTDCCTQIVGTAATGCAEAVASSTTTSTSPTTSTTAAPATVAGASANQLPETPVAQAVAGNPNYTG